MTPLYWALGVAVITLAAAIFQGVVLAVRKQRTTFRITREKTGLRIDITLPEGTDRTDVKFTVRSSNTGATDVSASAPGDIGTYEFGQKKLADLDPPTASRH